GTFSYIVVPAPFRLQKNRPAASRAEISVVPPICCVPPYAPPVTAGYRRGLLLPSARGSGEIFGHALLARGLHPPPLASAFAQGLLAPSQPFSIFLIYNTNSAVCLYAIFCRLLFGVIADKV